jgi:hypothetical protein
LTSLREKLIKIEAYPSEGHLGNPGLWNRSKFSLLNVAVGMQRLRKSDTPPPSSDHAKPTAAAHTPAG